MLCIIRIRAVNVAYEEVSQWLVTERLNRHWPLKFCLWGILHKSSSVQSVWTLVANLFEIVTFLFWLKKNTPTESKLKKKEFLFVYSSRGLESITMGKTWQQVCETSLAVRTQTENISAAYKKQRGSEQELGSCYIMTFKLQPLTQCCSSFSKVAITS